MMGARIITVECAWCNKTGEKQSSAVNRAVRINAPLYCNRDCAGMARRNGLTIEQRKERKANYDRQRRESLGEMLLQKKRRAYAIKVAFDAEELRRRQAERREKEKRNGYRAEYLSKDRYKQYKSNYDTEKRSAQYGEFAECHRLLVELKREIVSRCPNYYERHAETIKERAARAKRSQYTESRCR